jgi:act minimal PKS chain-length factor (CLF/KS beta)
MSAVITGIGVTAPNGVTVEEYWSAVLSGRSGIREVTGFDPSVYPARLAGQIVDFDDTEGLPGRLLPQTDRVTRLALRAADDALTDAGVDPTALPDYGMGVMMSNSAGGHEFTHREFDKLWVKGPEYVSVYESFAWFYACNSGQVSIRHGMRGPSAVVVGEQAGGLDALGHARRGLRRGTQLMLTGGLDSALDPWGFVSHLASGKVSLAADPARAYLPFDAQANGYVPGEGGAVLVLEDAERARERGATRTYGELAGYAATFDPAPGLSRQPGLRRAAELALADAGVPASAVDVVFADAAGVPELDRREAEAITGLFGAYGVPVTAPKALVGRLYAGGAPLDVATALLSIRDDVLPPTPHTTDLPDDYGLDLVRDTPREARVRCALVLARGHHGFNSAAVVRAA